MSWIRLCNSGADLSGTGGRVVPVSRQELARHNKVDDAWMAIRGRVFNVTRYMDFHPGGVDELMRGVGKIGVARQFMNSTGDSIAQDFAKTFPDFAVLIEWPADYHRYKF